VTVEVGVDANDGAFGFGPAAIRIDSGTTVTWEWNGRGGTHNVAHDGGDFESETTAEEGFTFEHQFDASGTSLYECTPHASIGMKGAVVVE
jgi:halocyanin-like protein